VLFRSGKDGYGYYGKYKIIIPSKEPINHPNILSNSLTNKVNKQEKSMKDTAEELAEIAIILTNNSANYQETLEEVAEKQCEVEGWGLYEGLSEQCAIKNSFKAGAIWQQEQDKKMYSEEDMKQAFHVGRLYLGREGDTNFEQFIEEFKNK
jgi:NTP pyrophosphatase (non-canonical NTP hydrolase)